MSDDSDSPSRVRPTARAPDIGHCHASGRTSAGRGRLAEVRDESDISPSHNGIRMMVANLIAVSMLLVSVYAQWSIPRLTSGADRIYFARLVLALLGIGIGYLGARIADTPEAPAIAAFVIGFGQVHVPAAIVEFVKATQSRRAVRTGPGISASDPGEGGWGRTRPGRRVRGQEWV